MNETLKEVVERLKVVSDELPERFQVYLFQKYDIDLDDDIERLEQLIE